MGSPPPPPPRAAATGSPPPPSLPLPPPVAAAEPQTPLAPGFRFHPTDVELVGYYLMRKIAGLPLRVDAIAEVELYKWAPWDLPRHSRLRFRDRQWFFFGTLDRKYDSSTRANRSTGQGFWKSTGKDRPVVVEGEGPGEGSKKTIGMKKSLVFHVGRCPHGRRTDWVMHEYRLEEDGKTVIGTWGTSYVVCRIFQKSAIGQKKSDDYGAPLLKGEWRDEEEARDSAPAAGEASPEVLRIAADDGQPEDFEQGTTEAMRSIDQLTISCEVSTMNSNPPSKGLLAPGFRFYPTDEELVFYYLKRKVSGLPFRVDVIADVNVYQWSPWDLPTKSCLSLSMLNTEWYFFSTLDRKYAFNRSYYNNRATVEGYWKSTGMDRSVRSHTEEKIIGMKKTLIFHRGRAPGGQRTDWVMHEYRLEEDEQNSKGVDGKGPSFVLCRIYQKSGVGPRKPRNLLGEPFTEEMVEATQALVPDREALQVPDMVVDTTPIVVIDDAQEENCVYISDDFEQETRENIYSIGGKVEIAYIREKLPVAWYMATVIKVINERVLLIEYESLKNDDGTLLSEVVSTQYIRPHPPPTLEVRNFDLLDEVEAFYNGGWWPGVVAKVNIGSRYNVKFMQWEEEIEFHHTELRFLYDWVDGQWIQASQDKSIESQHLAEPESVGHMQSSGSSNTARDCMFPVSVTPPRGCGDDEAPSMNYENENLERLTFQSELEGLRPSKKAKIGGRTEENTRSLDLRSTETSNAVKTGFDVRTPIIEEEPNFRIKALTEKCCSTSPFKKIDAASVDSITRPSSNNLSGEANESTLMPDQLSQALFHKPLSCNGEENLKCISKKSEFFPMGMYRGGWWSMVDSQQRKEIVPELDCEGDKGVILLTAGVKRRKNCRSQKLTIIEPSLEGDSMGNHHSNKVVEPPSEGLSAAQCVASSDNGSGAQGLFNVMTSSSDASLVETSASSIRPCQPGSEVQNKMLLPTVEKQSAKRGFNGKAGHSPLEQSPLPFEKSSSMWDTFESAEVFCVMPQQPHFRPLEHFCRDFREGMAIGLMVTFSKVVNHISQLEIGDSREKFDGILKALAHLEEHGFSVQPTRARMARLLMLKENQDRLAGERCTLKALLGKETSEKEILDAEIESVEKASTGLEQSLKHLYEEKTSLSGQKRENESRLNGLEMDAKRLEDAVVSAEQDFEATRCASW